MKFTIKREDTGLEQDTEAWGVDEGSLVISLENQGVDICTIRTTEIFDAEPQWPVETIISVWSDKEDGSAKVREFYGRVDKIKRIGTGQTEALSYSIVGPWWYFENSVFERFWNVLKNPLDPSEGTVQTRTSHVFLHIDDFGNKYTASAQLVSVISYCMNPQGGPDANPGPPLGAPIIGYIVEGLNLLEEPIEELQDTTCAEIIRRVLRWAPDSVVWFNYNNGQKYPTMHISRRDNMAVVNLNTADEVIEDIELNPRDDLKVSGVVITFERTNTVNGVAYQKLTRVAYPANTTGGEFKCVVASISLEGSVFNYTTARIVTAPVPSGKNDAFWTARNPWLTKVTKLVTTAVFREEGTVPNIYPNLLIDGQIADWMPGLKTDETLSTKANYTIENVGDAKDDPIEFKCVVTNLNTGTYYNITEAQWEEPQPLNLERYLYEAASVLHYDGQFQLCESDGEVSSRVQMGNLVNIVGMRAEWVDMKAMVQQITKQLQTGTVSVQIGPPKHLGMNDIIELLRMTRMRRRWITVNTMLYGKSSRGTSVDFGTKLTKHSSSVGKGGWEKLTIGTGPAQIILDPSLITNGKVIKPVLETVSIKDASGNCVEKQMWILASDKF
jgi:hypothetical protein